MECVETVPPQESQVRGINKRKRGRRLQFRLQRAATVENGARTVEIRAAFMHVQPRWPLQMSQNRPTGRETERDKGSKSRETTSCAKGSELVEKRLSSIQCRCMRGDNDDDVIIAS